LFTQYLLPFEVVAIILLSATIGAIVLTKPDKKRVTPFAQEKE
jgi:NADH:ubiquinone oxidoreductase subunit 6 (subunit J)